MRPCLVFIADCLAFVGLWCLRASLQGALEWPLWAHVFFFVPAFLYLWYRVPDPDTGRRLPLSVLAAALFALGAIGFLGELVTPWESWVSISLQVGSAFLVLWLFRRVRLHLTRPAERGKEGGA